MREATTITIKDGSRDLKFRVTPMSAVHAEKWLYRALCVLGIPALSGLRAFNAEGFMKSLSTADVDFDKIEPLLDKLLDCCEVVHDGGAAVQVTPETIGGVVEYPTSIFALRLAALKATFGFFGNGGWQNFLDQVSGVATALK